MRDTSSKSAFDKPGNSSPSITALVLVIAILVPLLATIPTWFGYLVDHPPEKNFMGFRFLAEDHYSYTSFISQAAEEGKLFMENRFTTEPQKGRFLLLYMWLVGQIARLTGLGIPASWELSRLLVGFAFMLIAWCFAGLLFKDVHSRLLAYLFVAFSGGIGWAIYLMLGRSRGVFAASSKDPFNFQWNWSTFGSMLLPLWVAPAAILLLCAYLIARNRRGWMWTLLGILLPPLIWFMHPYTGIAAYLTFFFFPLIPVAGAIWRLERIPWELFREKLAAVLPMLLSFAIVVCYLLWARQDQVYASNAKFVFTWTPTYSIFLYPFAYGLVLPLALYGLKWSGALGGDARDMMIAWLAASFILSVNPFLSGVKFQYLLHLPLAFFATHGLLELKRRSQFVRNLKGVAAFLIGALLFLNSALLLFKDFPSTARDRNIFLSKSEIDAMKFLKEQPAGNVLSSAWAGNRIPWLAAKKVYVGHWFLTIDHYEKLPEVAAFFGPQLPVDQKRSWLAMKEIRYVYYGSVERSAGAVDPALGLSTIYDHDGVTIYAVPKMISAEHDK